MKQIFNAKQKIALDLRQREEKASIRTRKHKGSAQMEKYSATSTKYVEELRKLNECCEAYEKMDCAKKSLEELREEEDKMFARANIQATWDALKKLREDKMSIMQ